MKKKDKWEKFIGIVIRGIDVSNPTSLEVFVPEFLPGKTGTVSSTEVTHSFTMDGYTGEVTSMDTTLVEHLNPNSNLSIPDIVPGEEVRVYKFANMDTFFWLPMTEDVTLRSREHIRLFIMNDPVVGPKETPPGLDKTYYIELNSKTKEKVAKLVTGVSDGEPYGYDISVYPEDGKIEVKDTHSTAVGPNIILLDSATGTISATNKEGCFVELKEKNITATAIQDLTANAVNVHINTSTNTNITAEGDVNITTTGKTVITSTDDTNITCKNCNITAETTCHIKATDAIIEGNCTIKSGTLKAENATPGPPDMNGPFIVPDVCPITKLPLRCSMYTIG